MPCDDTSETKAAAAQRIKKEIDKLAQEQSKALGTAVYVGMSRNEAKEYDERAMRIKKLVSELANLCKEN